ncbi:MAG: cytochrome ubiquinol oxidase subunit I [Nitrospirales bacterium]|nr:cytochrome ubiquinol oxidase subunit I [Nitrospirales bacterium]
MTDLIAARSQMAISLGFHIIFAAIGIAMPLMMTIAEWRWLRTGDNIYLTLAKRWAKGTAILFAVGAMSGTVLSFELGLLWPSFMNWAGPLIGPLFALEGFAFFTEAIFLGLYLYGWTHLRPRVHLATGMIVALSGVASAIAVVIANAWMNSPIGFELVDGRPTQIDPIAAMRNPHAADEAIHMVLAAFAATGFVVAGIHSYLLLRDRANVFHRRALEIALVVGGVTAVLQPLSGDVLARTLAHHQPAKLAAFEALFRTQEGAPFLIGGLPDADRQEVRYGIEIPYVLSLLLYHDPHATVAGLDTIPRENWPPVATVHVAFQLMVASGFIMAGLALWAGWRWWRGQGLQHETVLLRALVLASPLGFLAIESGWVVTEVGRQPWIIYGVMRTSDAVTPMPGLWVPMITFTLLYGVLGLVVVWLLKRHIAAAAVN